MHKVSSNMSLAILKDIFASKATPYNMRNQINGLQWYWDSIPFSTKNLELRTTRNKAVSITLQFFKSKIKYGLHIIVPADYTKNNYIN